MCSFKRTFFLFTPMSLLSSMSSLPSLGLNARTHLHLRIDVTFHARRTSSLYPSASVTFEDSHEPKNFPPSVRETLEVSWRLCASGKVSLPRRRDAEGGMNECVSLSHGHPERCLSKL